jgi:hypothetical protein
VPVGVPSLIVYFLSHVDCNGHFERSRGRRRLSGQELLALWAMSDLKNSQQLVRAIEFAARKHRLQRRKDVDASPYINHPIALVAAWQRESTM